MPATTDFQPYDLVFCYDPSLVGSVISYGTFSLLSPSAYRRSPSHVAVICDDPAGHGKLWVESTTLAKRACVIQGRPVSGVQAHHPQDRMNDYLAAGGRVACYRIPQLIRKQLKFEVLREEFTAMLINGFVKRHVGYDLTHAILSGTRFWSLSRLMAWSDRRTVFCSELAAFADMWLGILSWENQQIYSPGRLLRQQVRSGVRSLAWSVEGVEGLASSVESRAA